MDSTKRDNKEVQEKLMALQKEKDQVCENTILFHTLSGKTFILMELLKAE